MQALLLDKSQLVIRAELLNHRPAVVIQLHAAILYIARLRLEVKAIVHLAGNAAALAANTFCNIY